MISKLEGMLEEVIVAYFNALFMQWDGGNEADHQTKGWVRN